MQLNAQSLSVFDLLGRFQLLQVRTAVLLTVILLLYNNDNLPKMLKKQEDCIVTLPGSETFCWTPQIMGICGRLSSKFGSSTRGLGA